MCLASQKQILKKSFTKNCYHHKLCVLCVLEFFLIVSIKLFLFVMSKGQTKVHNWVTFFKWKIYWSKYMQRKLDFPNWTDNSGATPTKINTQIWNVAEKLHKKQQDAARCQNILFVATVWFFTKLKKAYIYSQLSEIIQILSYSITGDMKHR